MVCSRRSVCGGSVVEVIDRVLVVQLDAVMEDMVIEVIGGITGG